MQEDSLPFEQPGKPNNTGVGSLSLLQGIFPTQELNWHLLRCRRILYQLSYQGRPAPVVVEVKEDALAKRGRPSLSISPSLDLPTPHALFVSMATKQCCTHIPSYGGRKAMPSSKRSPVKSSVGRVVPNLDAQSFHLSHAWGAKVSPPPPNPGELQGALGLQTGQLSKLRSLLCTRTGVSGALSLLRVFSCYPRLVCPTYLMCA